MELREPFRKIGYLQRISEYIEFVSKYIDFVSKYIEFISKYIESVSKYIESLSGDFPNRKKRTSTGNGQCKHQGNTLSSSITSFTTGWLRQSVSNTTTWFPIVNVDITCRLLHLQLVQRSPWGRHDVSREGVRRGRGCFFAERGTTWLATQVCPRTVKAGLGGHDAGASGGRRGCRKHIAPDMKTGSTRTVGFAHLQWICKKRKRTQQY